MKTRQKPHLLAFAPNQWNGLWMNRQQLLSRLARRGWPITYSTGALSLWERRTEKFINAPWRREYRTINGVNIERPSKTLLRWQRFKRYDWQIVRRHASALLRRVRGSGAVAYIFHPAFAPYAKALRGCRTVYHAYDLFSMQPDWTDELACMERELVARADLVIAGTSSTLAALQCADRGVVLPNGADAKAFAEGPRLACPADLADIPRPRIGYIGNLNRKVDFSIIAALAKSQPQWHWVLVGPVSTSGPGAPETDKKIAVAYRTCRRLPNIHFLGSKPHAELPAYAGHMDVNTMCYRADEGWWQFGSPLKLHEYLATGRPVVSTDLPDLRGFSKFVGIVREPGEWSAAIEAALSDHSTIAAQSRRCIAFTNSWDRRVDRLELLLQTISTAAI